MKVLNGYQNKELKKLAKIADKVLALEEQMTKLSDTELKQKTAAFKARYQKGESLDSILPEAFAVCREASWRVLGLRPYRVQLIGGIILHQGRIAEMRTGEGKTLVSTLPAYLNALEGKGVHIVTVNDYLANRDADWMGKIHEFLGLTVGVVLNSSTKEERQTAYNCDITYITNNELGFDYLRDNMVIYKEQLVQRDLHYAIIDEIDSILIDEARTPLIISGQSGKSTKLYELCDYVAHTLKRGEASKEFSKMDAIMGVEREETGDFIVNEIVCYLESGYFDTTYLQQYFAAEDASLNSWDNLYDYWRLNNEEYEKHYEETVRYYFEDKSVDLKELFVIISILSVLYSDNLVQVSEEDIIAQGKQSIDRLMEGISDMEGLLSCNSKVHAGARRNHSNIGSDRILNVLVAYFQKLFEQRFEKCPNKVSVMLENLTDETCERLNLALNDAIPVKRCLYKDTSIFQEANADKVSKSILGLSNESRNTFLHFLQSRYKYTSYGTEIEYLNECCQSDLPQLKLINEKLKTEAANRRLIEKYSIEKITNLIDEITAKVK